MYMFGDALDYKLGERNVLTPPPNQMYSETDSCLLISHKVSTSIRGGGRILLHKPCHEVFRFARSSCAAPEWVRTRFEVNRKQNGLG